MTLQATRTKDGTRKQLRWEEDGGKKYEGVEVDANDENVDMLKEMSSGKDEHGLRKGSRAKKREKSTRRLRARQGGGLHRRQE